MLARTRAYQRWRSRQSLASCHLATPNQHRACIRFSQVIRQGNMLSEPQKPREEWRSSLPESPMRGETINPLRPPVSIWAGAESRSRLVLRAMSLSCLALAPRGSCCPEISNAVRRRPKALAAMAEYMRGSIAAVRGPQSEATGFLTFGLCRAPHRLNLKVTEAHGPHQVLPSVCLLAHIVGRGVLTDSHGEAQADIAILMGPFARGVSRSSLCLPLLQFGGVSARSHNCMGVATSGRHGRRGRPALLAPGRRLSPPG